MSHGSEIIQYVTTVPFDVELEWEFSVDIFDEDFTNCVRWHDI